MFRPPELCGGAECAERRQSHHPMTRAAFSTPAGAADTGPLPAEDRFTCLPGCGLCCSYRVLVTEAELQRLQSARAFPGAAQPSDATADGRWALLRGSSGSASGFCLFLDALQRCTVYEDRPGQCRTYPYLWVAYSRLELDVDLSCPGLGRGDVARGERRQPPAESPASQARREQSIRQVQSLLRAQQLYAAPEKLVALGERFVDDMAVGWPSATILVNRVRPMFVNGQVKEGHAVPQGELSLFSQPMIEPQDVRSVPASAALMERHFSRPQWNTHLAPDGRVTVYRFWIADNILYLEDRDGTQQTLPLGDAAQLPWQPEALATRRAYLRRWLKRQLPVRLANNMALASLAHRSHVATCYLQFLTEIDWRLAVLAPALARACGQAEVGRAVVLEAVRGSDALLRSWCESARVGVTG